MIMTESDGISTVRGMNHLRDEPIKNEADGIWSVGLVVVVATRLEKEGWREPPLLWPLATLPDSSSLICYTSNCSQSLYIWFQVVSSLRLGKVQRQCNDPWPGLEVEFLVKCGKVRIMTAAS